MVRADLKATLVCLFGLVVSECAAFSHLNILSGGRTSGNGYKMVLRESVAGRCPVSDIKKSFLEDNTQRKAATRAATRSPKALSSLAGYKLMLASVRGTTHRYLLKLMRKHGDSYIISNRLVVLNEPNAIRDVLETHNLEKTNEVKRGYQFMFYRKGAILAAPWKRWIEQRRMTAPALAESVIGELAPKFELGSRPVMQLIEHAAKVGKVVEMDQAFTALAFDTIGLVLLGRSFGAGDKLLSGDQLEVPFSQALNVLTKEVLRQMTLPCRVLQLFPPGGKVEQAREVIDGFLEACIADRIEERANNGGSKNTDLLNILLDAEENGLIRRDDVKGQLLTFIYAGHDTTAHTLSWLLYEVASNKNLQHQLYEEARKALPSREDFPVDPDIVKNQLPLLDRVWMETNRKHPAAATGTVRKVGNKPIVVGDNLELPARASVFIPPFTLHRNEKYWPNPEVFDPSRWEDDKVAARDPMAFQAFSAGPRNCIGGRLARAEALSVMASLLRRFEITCIEKGEPADIYSLTRRPRNGIHFKFKPRAP